MKIAIAFSEMMSPNVIFTEYKADDKSLRVIIRGCLRFKYLKAVDYDS